MLPENPDDPIIGKEQFLRLKGDAVTLDPHTFGATLEQITTELGDPPRRVQGVLKYRDASESPALQLSERTAIVR